VFAAWTEPGQLNRWIAAKAEAAPRFLFLADPGQPRLLQRRARRGHSFSGRSLAGTGGGFMVVAGEGRRWCG
jgi:uncharacterized protein YndB with AHSA1/START domain